MMGQYRPAKRKGFMSLDLESGHVFGYLPDDLPVPNGHSMYLMENVGSAPTVWRDR